MTPARRTAAVALAVVVALSLALAGCSTRQLPNVGVATARGGTLTVLLDDRVDAWDPQRIGRDDLGAFAGRTFLRTLTAATPAGAGFFPGLVGDLAVTTGDWEDGGRVWTFTLVTDAPWQDGRFVTCADVKYGISRSFAADRVAGGSQDAVQLLDIPTYNDSQGHVRSAYEGPYSGKNQSFYDHAVSCDGTTITFRLNQPRFDFPQIVSLPAFAPVRKDQDTDRTDPLSVFSSGPYMLEGVWKPGEGGRFVRNRKWVPRDDPVRMAWPDVIEVEEGLPTTTVVQRIVDDHGTDQNALTWADAPPAMAGQLAAPELASRVTRPDSGRVDVLLPSRTSAAMGNPSVRKAFALATDRDAYAAADGTPMTPVTSALAHNLPGRLESNPLGTPTGGDPGAARTLLASANVATPVPLRVAYRPSEAAGRGFAALTPAWAKAGFEVTLVPVPEPAATSGAVTDPAAYDVVEGTVSGAWPSGSAVLPALVDATGDPALLAASRAAQATSNQGDRNEAWGAVDASLVGAGDVVPLAERQRVLVRGSGILAYQDNVLLDGLPDLATVEVTHEAAS